VWKSFEELKTQVVLRWTLPDDRSGSTASLHPQLGPQWVPRFRGSKQPTEWIQGATATQNWSAMRGLVPAPAKPDQMGKRLQPALMRSHFSRRRVDGET